MSIHIILFLFLHGSICCGYSLEVPWWGASNEYHDICFCREVRKISILFWWKTCLIWSCVVISSSRRYVLSGHSSYCFCYRCSIYNRWYTFLCSCEQGSVDGERTPHSHKERIRNISRGTVCQGSCFCPTFISMGDLAVQVSVHPFVGLSMFLCPPLLPS